MTAIMLTVVIGMAAFAVDLGMQRVVRSDMQALADVVALDAARLLDGRNAGDIRAGAGDPDPLDSVVSTSAARHSTLGDIDNVTGHLVYLAVGPNGEQLPKRDASGRLEPVPDDRLPDAVYVVANGSIDFNFAPGSGGATRTALGVAASTACFRLGSYALAVDSENSALLDRLVGDALNVSGLSYAGLANASVTMLELATQLNVGTADEFASLEHVTLHDLFVASANALQASGGATANIDLLNTLAERVDSSAELDIADLVSVASGSSAALAGTVSILDVVAASAFLVNGVNLLDASLLIREPFISAPDADEIIFRVVERPQMACGPVGATAQTAQLFLKTALPLHQFNTPGLGLQSDPTQISVNVDIASATGELAKIDCGPATIADPESIEVDIERVQSRASMTVSVRLSGNVKATDLGLSGTVAGIPILSQTQVSLDITVYMGTAGSTPSFADPATPYEVPDHTYVEPETAGTGGGVFLPEVSLVADDVTSVTARIGSTEITLPPSAVTTILNKLSAGIVTDALNPLVESLNNVISPTAELLGVHMAGADLYGVPRPRCGNPALRG